MADEGGGSGFRRKAVQPTTGSGLDACRRTGSGLERPPRRRASRSESSPANPCFCGGAAPDGSRLRAREPDRAPLGPEMRVLVSQFLGLSVSWLLRLWVSEFRAGFLFLVLYPAASRQPPANLPPTSRQPAHTQLVHTQLAHTQLNTPLPHTQLVHTQLAHTQLNTPLPHTQLVHTQLAHTQLVHTQLVHTQLVFTQLAHTQLAHTQLAHTQLVHTQLAHTQLVHTQLVHTQLVHTQLAHTLLVHTQLAHTHNSTHHFLTHNLSTRNLLTHNLSTHTQLVHTQLHSYTTQHTTYSHTTCSHTTQLTQLVNQKNKKATFIYQKKGCYSGSHHLPKITILRSGCASTVVIIIIITTFFFYDCPVNEINPGGPLVIQLFSINFDLFFFENSIVRGLI